MTHLRKKMLEELERRNYSASTTRCSLGVVQDLARYFQQAPDRLGPDQIRSYQAHLFRDCKLAGNTVSQRLAALRFFYLKTLRRSWNQSLTPYPKRARRLPSVLSPEEVARLIDCADSTFHRMLRMTLYATGVRRAHQAPSSGGASLILTGLSRTLPSRLVRIAGLPSHGCFILMPVVRSNLCPLMGLAFRKSCFRSFHLLGFIGVLFAANAPAQQEPALFSQPPLPSPQPGDTEIHAFSQEFVGTMRYLRGSVEIHFGNSVITAEEVDYNESTGEVEARGDVRFRNTARQEDLHASKISYNSRTEVGTFYDVHGTVGSASQGSARSLSTDNPFYIDGKVVHKTAEHFSVYDGFVTNCDINSPWWTLTAPRTKIVPGKSATVHGGVFRLRKVPLFYFPIFKKSLERLPRGSGFLTPNIGNSSRFGLVFGQSYYWAINRSFDATIGGTLYTERGFASQIGLRGRPTADSHFDAYFFAVKDRGLKLDDGRRIKQGGRSFTMKGSAAFPGGFRGVAEINHLSSLEFRQAFTQSFNEAVFSQVRSIGYVTNNFSTFSLNATFLRNENFQSVEAGDTVIIRKLPSVEFGSHDRQIVGGPVPLWLSFDSSFGLVSRTQPLFQTRRFVQRGDIHPRLTSKFYWRGFHFTPALGARSTSYGQSRNEIGALVGANLYRNTREASLDIALPALERVYDGPKWLGQKVKHVIEPRLSYRFVDGVEDFNQVIRFDDVDLVNNTNEAELSLINRVYAKDASGRVREVFTMEVRQRRYFDPEFGGAVVPGRRNVLQSTIGLTPFAFADQARNYSPIATTFRIRPAWRYALEWRYDYDPLRKKVVNTSVNADFRLNNIWSVTIGHNAVRTPTVLSPPSNQLFTIARIGDFNRRGWNFAVSNIYDYRQAISLYTAIQSTYNTDCCGFSAEWRRFAIGRTRNDNQIRVTLSIANVGSFGTLRPQERMF